MKRIINLSLFLIMILTTAPIWAEVTPVLHFQGRVTEPDGTPYTGTHTITLSIYDVETGGSPIYSNGYSCNLQNGYFNLYFGNEPAMDLSKLPFDKQYWLGVRVDGLTEMSPREKLSSVAYAMRAQTAVQAESTTIAASVVDNAITSNKIVDGTITGSDVTTTIGQRLSVNHIEPGGLQGANISSTPGERIGNNNIEDNAINSRTIADGTVTQADAPFAAAFFRSGSQTNNVKVAYGTGVTDASGLATIVFADSGVTFTQPPVVICTAINDTYQVSMQLVNGPTTNGVQVHSRYSNEGLHPTGFHWIAIGY